MCLLVEGEGSMCLLGGGGGVNMPVGVLSIGQWFSLTSLHLVVFVLRCCS